MKPEEFRELRRLARHDANIREAKAKKRNEYEAAQCQGKPRFQARADALVAARRRGVHPYHCGVCHGWHVGSNEHMRKKKLAKLMGRPK